MGLYTRIASRAVLQVVFKICRNERDPSANWIIIGVLVSIVGLIVQAIPFGDPEGWINNNSVFHIVQMFALHCYYNGARYMRDI